MSPMPSWFQIAPASWEMWAAIGLACVALDMALGYSGALIAMGIAALLLAGASALGAALGVALIPNWSVALIAYAVLAAGCAVVARRVVPKPKTKDINEY